MGLDTIMPLLHIEERSIIIC